MQHGQQEQDGETKPPLPGPALPRSEAYPCPSWESNYYCGRNSSLLATWLVSLGTILYIKSKVRVWVQRLGDFSL